VNEVYAGAAHGYSMADTSMYDEAGAERHFRVLQDLFARTLGD
jgi:carboxymethylenebutenolidase